MSENKFTEGPWQRDKYGSVIAPDGEKVAFRGVTIMCSGSFDRIAEAEANTDLVAAATELLALLVESQTSIGGDWRQRRDIAIAKARGES